ncbi:adenosine A2a receptor b [Eucyclogobius newberryi]|uniref:adenosine A2a receptor b n=1 Tax=Eucyclogobius newberryi TaxID=166745 RepID=UPI003B5BA95B
MIKNDQLVYIGLEVVMACLAVFGNVLVCWAVRLNSNLQSVTNLFVVSLAVADIAVGLLAIPFAIAISTGFCAHFHGCLFIACFVLVLTQSSIFSLLAIAIDRYIAIKNPLRYSSVVTGQRAKAIVALCWILSVTIGLTPILGWNTGGSITHSNICPRGMTECLFEGVVTLHYMVYFNFFGCVLLPLLAMLVIYANIFMAARRQLRLIGPKAAPSGNVPIASSKSTLQKEVHAAKSLAIIVGLFAFCWLPVHVINCINHLCPGCERPHVWVMNVAIILSHANSVVNPFIYAYRIREFRHTFKRILSQHILGCRDRQQTDVRNGNNSGGGCRKSSTSHTSKEGSTCSTVVNSYAVDPSSENAPPKADQKGSNNWTTLDTMSNCNVLNGHKVSTHVSQVHQRCYVEGPYEENHQDLLDVMDNGHNITFVNVQAVMQRQTGSKHSTELPEVS